MTDHAADAPPRDRRAAIWPRAAFMALFAILTAIAETLLLAIAILQALWLLFAGAPNSRIAGFGAQLGDWLAAVARYQAVATEAKPFPFADWPQPRT